MIKVSIDELNKIAAIKSYQVAEYSFKSVLPPQKANSDSLCFCGSPELAEIALANNCKGLIITDKVLLEWAPPADCAIWTTSQINMAMSQVLHLFDPKKHVKQGIHPTAFIAPTARIGQNVTIGAYATIEEHAVIEDNCQIAAHVVIGAFCTIGKNCIIASHTTIGSDGFGFYTDKTNTHHKIPQIGKVIIEDNCEIGSHCAIDRATLTETRIGAGTKFDNFCHVAHNCQIGKNGLFAAGFMVAGSTQIGNNVTTAGGVHITGHITICDNVVLGGRAGITSSIDTPGFYSGFPHMPHKENLRIMMSLAQLPKIRKQLVQVVKKLGLTEDT